MLFFLFKSPTFCYIVWFVSSHLLQVQEILDVREKANGKTEYKIRWRGFGPDEDTWEPEKNLLDCGEILNDFKKRQSKQDTRRTPSTRNTPQISRTRTADNKGDAASVQEQKVSKVAMATNTPALRRTRVRQRSTPKVQRVLGIKQMPANVIDKTALEIGNNGKNAKAAESNQEVKVRLNYANVHVLNPKIWINVIYTHIERKVRNFTFYNWTDLLQASYKNSFSSIKLQPQEAWYHGLVFSKGY